MINKKILAELCGIHAGDGYLRNDGHRKELDISGSYEEKEYYDDHVIPLFNKVFDIDIKGRFFPSRHTYGFVIRKPQIIEYFHELGFPYGKKSLIVRVPDFILKDLSLAKNFLRGHFDTDGCIIFGKRFGSNYSEFSRTRHYYPRILITTVSPNLADDLKKVLSDLKINAKCYTSPPRVENEHIRYNLNINGIKEINKWLDLIGIANPVQYSRYLIWKKHGFCPPSTTYTQRLKIIEGSLNPNLLYKGL